MNRYRPTVAVVDLDAIRHNVREIAPENAAFMAVVKADAYGHGTVPVARAAIQAGAAWLGVALVEEGIQIREAGLDSVPILVLSEFPPGSEKDGLASALTPSIFTYEGLARVSSAAASLGEPVGVHVKVDTGMHRAGIQPQGVLEFVRAAVGRGLVIEGVWTHFANADDPTDPFTTLQLERFREVTTQLSKAGVRPRYLHAANSAAAIAHPSSHLDLVRVGVAMYGLPPGPELAGMADLRLAMSWFTTVAAVRRVPAGEGISYGLRYILERESTIATVPVGYADGYRRLLSGRASVLIRGRRYPVVGSVTMDQTLVDCADDPVEAGDEVVMLGRQGPEEITADEIGTWLETINYEVVCAVGKRVPREYVGDA